MENSKTVFARNLQKYMNENGKTRNDICHDLGFRYSTFADWFRGLKYPRIDKIELLANYFGIEKSDLIEEKQPTPEGGLSEIAIKVAELVDMLPEESRKQLLVRVQALVSAQSGLDDLLKHE